MSPDQRQLVTAIAFGGVVVLAIGLLLGALLW